MYPQAGQFNTTGSIFFEEAKHRPLDLRRFQSAMFTDRPDLWRKPQRNHKAAPAEQFIMFTDPENVHLGKPPTCSTKKKGPG